MRYISYLIYILVWECLVWIGAGYAVFVLNHSGWWMLLAAFLSMVAYKPENWFQPEKDK